MFYMSFINHTDLCVWVLAVDVDTLAYPRYKV